MKNLKTISILAIGFLLAFSSCSDDDKTTETPKEYTGVYFMDTYNEDIETLAIAGGKSDTLKSNAYGCGIAYDKTNEKIFYSDFTDDGDGKIYKMNTDGSNSSAIVAGINEPYGIAIDSKNGKIYWGDSDGNVSRCDLDGSNKETGIATIEGGAVRAIAVDETHRKIYFYEVNNSNLYMADLDGSNAKVVVAGYYGYAIAVDETRNKIYFDAQSDDQAVSGLYRANLDGSNPIQVDNTGSRIYGIAIDEANKKVYWSGRDTYEIYEANLNGTSKVILASDLGSPRGIFLKY